MLNDSNRPAQLAAGAARASANGTSSVIFHVRTSTEHGPRWSASGDNPEHPPLPLEQNDSLLLNSGEVEETTLFNSVLGREELLFFSSGGIDFQISTRGTNHSGLADEPVTARQLKVTPGALSIFEGRAALNPGFLYESAQQLEVMIEFGAGPWRPSQTDGAIATKFGKELARLAASEARAPILFMHLPAAPYKDAGSKERSSGSLEAIRSTHALCIRMSLALLANRTDARLRFLEAVGRLAQEWGLGLHISDRRPGRIRGEWITVRTHSPRTFQERVQEYEIEPGRGLVRIARPVTVIGPARVGSSHAVLQALEQHRVGVTGVAVSSMQEVAFINLVVAQSVLQNPPTPSGTYSLSEGLAQTVAFATGQRFRATRKLQFGDLTAASDYVVLIGEPHPVVVDEVDAPPGRPLWLIWDVPFGVVDLDDVVRALDAVLSRNVQSHVVQYARARLTGTGRARGRAKVSARLTQVRFPDGGIREYLGSLCELVEREIRRTVAAQSTLSESEVRIRVMWRERWLGSWDAPL